MGADTLKAMVLDYQRCGQGLAELVQLLALRIYRYPLLHHGHDEDDCGEFYLFFYPRLLRCLARFRDQGKPFEWYLNAVLRWHWKAYRRRQQREQEDWRFSGAPELWDETADPAAGGPDDGDTGNSAHVPGLSIDRRQSGRADRRRLLLVALKNVHSLPDESLQAVSRLAGVPRAWLEATVDRLRQRSCAREVRLHALYARRNRCFAALLREERALRWQGDPGERAELLQRLQRLRERLRRSQAQIRRVCLRPTNREIAALTQIPKGSVDTSIYWLRRRLAAGRGEPREPQALRGPREPLSA